MGHANQLLWTEKYRPKSLDELILPERILKKLRQGVYQNLLLYGSPGTGKTSSAFIMALNHPEKYINCSLDSSVENVRNTITEFGSTLSLMDGDRKMKVIILDEFDGVSNQYMKALRGTIEKFAKTTRFIATCNYFNQIPEEIRSRFECINFDFSAEEEKELLKKYLIRIKEILTGEGISIDNKTLIELVKRKFPDLRSLISILQGFHAEGKTEITIEDINSYHGKFKDIYDLIFSSSAPKDNYQYLVSNYSNRVDDVINSLGTDFFDYVELEQPTSMKYIGKIAYEVHKHSYERNFVVDPVITMLSLIFKLQATVKGA